jgi:hypothetical protein
MAAGVPDDMQPRHPRLTLVAMVVAATVIAAAATIAVARSDLPEFLARRHKSSAAAASNLPSVPTAALGVATTRGN